MSEQTPRFEHFEIQKNEVGELMKLGPGGMGTTYRAYDLHLRKLVALKIINERTLADPTARRRFFNEARAAASIDHPNVARVLYLCPETAVDCFFAMELVEGESLAQRISHQGPLAPGKALLMLRPVADALVALGEKNLVHRDIKPENIMIAAGGEGASHVKLIDFGLAKMLVANSRIFESVHTGERFVGSVYFASPEQIRPTTGQLDARSDFYSLGATLWHVLTGFPPFRGTVFEVQEAHVYREPPWDMLAAQPKVVHALLRHLLAKDPAHRPASAVVLLELWDETIRLLAAEPNQEPAGAAAQPHATVVDVATPPPAPAPAPAVAPAPISGTLVQCDNGDRLFVRQVPTDLNAEFRAALLRAARVAQPLRHPHLLEIPEVQDDRIATAWPSAIAASTLAASGSGALPVTVVSAWLPRLAETLDFACERGLPYVGVQPERLLIGLNGEARSPRDPRTHEQWGAAPFWLDPLAGFDQQLALALLDPQAGASSRRLLARTNARDFIAALARCVRQLLGARDGKTGPIAGLSDARHELLQEALDFRSTSPTVRHWVETFLKETAPRFRPAGQPTSPRIPSPAETPAPPPEKRPPAPAPVATSPPAPAPHPHPTQAPDAPALAAQRPPHDPVLPLRPPMRKQPLLLGAAVLLLVLGVGFWWKTRNPETEEFRNIMDGVEERIRVRDFATAGQRLVPARELFPTSPRLRAAELAIRQGTPIAASRPPPTPEAKPGPTAKPTPSFVSDPALAGPAAPFRNSLGMDFVPVRVSSGGAPAAPILFSVYETRVVDFEAFANRDRWARLPSQGDDHPAVNVRVVDAFSFAYWLTVRDTARNKLFAGWVYRLPTDYEWSRAAGLATKGGPILVHDSASATSAPSWPPVAGQGNFADAALGRLNRELQFLPDYDDGFAFTAPVGHFRRSPSGLYDLFGNAAEWCSEKSLPAGYKTPPPGTSFVLRGGSWRSAGPSEISGNARDHSPPDVRSDQAGFRLVLTRADASLRANGNLQIYPQQPTQFGPAGLFTK